MCMYLFILFKYLFSVKITENPKKKPKTQIFKIRLQQAYAGGHKTSPENPSKIAPQNPSTPQSF